LGADRQRIDKWLWHARVVKTRTLAQELAVSGHVRLNGVRIDAASRPVKLGDTLTIALENRVRVLEVKGFAERRGSATVASTLFDDHSPPPPERPEPVATGPRRDPGTGRPTKRDRRMLDRFEKED
jgi:ribosome-associated heat shock protein Hsp15